MKRIIKYIFVIMLFFSLIDTVSAKTLLDLKNELALYEKEINEAQNRQKLTQDEINIINERARKLSENIEKEQIVIKKTESEIAELEKNADDKEEQIKYIFSFLQVTNSENAYMEYIFGAQTIEDLVLRSAVSEQMIAYNDDLINDYNEAIKAYKAKNKELKEQINSLNSEQENLEAELVKLGDSLSGTLEEMASVKSQIEIQKKMIEYYEDTLECSNEQDIDVCGGSVPYSGEMSRPIISGAVSSEFGYRLDPIKKVWKLHSGTDMYGSTDVYSVAPGVVAGISWKNSCGGTMLFVHHNINGEHYTSTYMHLYQVLVKTGDYVDQNTKIAITGGTNSLTPWDGCSTGRHLHLSIAGGLYMKDYVSWSTYTSKLVNPRTMVNLPIIGVWFNNRSKIY